MLDVVQNLKWYYYRNYHIEPNSILIGQKEWCEILGSLVSIQGMNMTYDKFMGLKIFRVLDESCLKVSYIEEISNLGFQNNLERIRNE